MQLSDMQVECTVVHSDSWFELMHRFVLDDLN